MNITQKTSTHNTTVASGRTPQYIVIHYTAGVASRAGSALNTADYFKNTANEVSSDFIVDDTAIVQYNADILNRYCWHCGGSKYNNKGGSLYGIAQNSNSIGIEVCSTNSTSKVTIANDKYWSFTDAVVANTVELVKNLMQIYNIDADHVIRHYDVTGKPCPGIIGWNLDSGDDSKWSTFKAKLTSVTTAKQLYRIRKTWADVKSQIGAYASLDNAKKACLGGYCVFDNAGNMVYSVSITFAKGQKISLKTDASLYASATSATPVRKLSAGTYFIYDGNAYKNGRYRITTRRDLCGKTPAGQYVTGYVSAQEMILK